MLAALQGRLLCIEHLLQAEDVDACACDKEGNTALHLAVRNGHLACVKRLVDTNAFDVNGVNKYRNTALMQAADSGRVGCVKYLVSLGADVNARDWDGNSALMKACRGGEVQCVKILCGVGQVEDGYRDQYGRTASMIAVINTYHQCLPYFIDYTVIGEESFELEVTPTARTAADALGRGGAEATPTFVFRFPEGNSVQYFPGVKWTRPYMYRDGGHEVTSVLNITVRCGLGVCVTCYLLGGLTIPAGHGDIPCCHSLLYESETSVCDNSGLTDLQIAATACLFDCLLYLVKRERVRLHALVLLFQEHFQKFKTVPLVLFEKLHLFINDYDQVDHFLDILCKGSHSGKCVDFLLSAFISRNDSNGSSSVSSVAARGSLDCLALLLEHLTDYHRISNHTKRIFLDAAGRNSGLEILSVFLRTNTFEWSWYPEFPSDKQRYLARELVTGAYSPDDFEVDGKPSSPLRHAFVIDDAGLAKYLAANLFLTPRDLRYFHCDSELRDHVLRNGSKELQDLHGNLFSTPWRLEALAVLKVSTLLTNKCRRIDMNELDEEVVLQEDIRLRLAFMNPIRRLCLNEWDTIDVGFLNRSGSVWINEKKLHEGKCCIGGCRGLTPSASK